MEEQAQEIIFDETQLEDVQAIAQQLFMRGAQPGDPGDQRTLVRPPVPWGRIALAVLLTALVSGGAFVLARRVLPTGWAVLVALFLLAVILAVGMKRIIITGVEIYQHFAPDAIRNKCRFEPSCSEYMIRAVRKYGVCRGVRKGVDRLCRCNIHNGGYDEP